MIGAMNHRLSSLRSRYTDAGPEGPHPQPRTLDSRSEGVKPISAIVRPFSQRVLPDCACVCPPWAPQPRPRGRPHPPSESRREAAREQPLSVLWAAGGDLPRRSSRNLGLACSRRALRGTSRRNRPSVVPPRNTLARPNKGSTSGGDQAWHPDEDESPIEASAQCPIRGVRRLTGAGADREAITESARP